MGQNNFVLLGFLSLIPEKDPIIDIEGIPYVRALMESGPADVGEAHPVFITGEAANVAHRLFKNFPNGFLALGSGKLKTFNNATLLIINFLLPFEPNDWLVRRSTGIINSIELMNQL